VTAPANPSSSHSPLGEAVEQASDAVAIWSQEVATFAESEADDLASGNYHLSNLVTAPVRLLKIWVRNSVKTAGTLSDNLALLSYSRLAGAASERSFMVALPLAAAAGALTSSDLLGVSFLHRIPSTDVRLEAVPAAESPPGANVVRVVVGCAGAPNDAYSGVLSSTDGAAPLAILVAIDELGDPLP
jgi:hypothetical protein